jgi:hypothetical protein
MSMPLDSSTKHLWIVKFSRSGQAMETKHPDPKTHPRSVKFSSDEQAIFILDNSASLNMQSDMVTFLRDEPLMLFLQKPKM